ncbi:hypothetical protein ACFE04_025291 [Oxalis oulophora]
MDSWVNLAFGAATGISYMATHWESLSSTEKERWCDDDNQWLTQKYDNFAMSSLTASPTVFTETKRFLPVGRRNKEFQALPDTRKIESYTYAYEGHQGMEKNTSSLFSHAKSTTLLFLNELCWGITRASRNFEEAIQQQEGGGLKLVLTFGLSDESRKPKQEHRRELLSYSSSRVSVTPFCSQGNTLPNRNVTLQHFLDRGFSFLTDVYNRYLRNISPQSIMEIIQNGWRSQEFLGSSHGMLLFFLGMIIGMISPLISGITEVDGLNVQQEQTQSLIIDLQEELKLKDLLTVDELPTENSVNSSAPTTSYTQNELNQLEIEAELEAELEKLELNTNEYDFRADITQPDFSGSESDQSRKCTDQLIQVTDAVSPLELSLRLNEVIQSRLEARVMELEKALELSHKRLHCLESENTIVYKTDMN